MFESEAQCVLQAWATSLDELDAESWRRVVAPDAVLTIESEYDGPQSFDRDDFWCIVAGGVDLAVYTVKAAVQADDVVIAAFVWTRMYSDVTVMTPGTDRLVLDGNGAIVELERHYLTSMQEHYE